MQDSPFPIAIFASEAPPRTKPSNYPALFAAQVAGREKRPLGDRFGLTNFGVNLTRLAPGAASALRHAHSLQDEFVYVLSGHPTLVAESGEVVLSPGMCAGFRAGTGQAHHLINRTTEDATFLEVGDRTAGDAVTYPHDDLKALLGPDGNWQFIRKDGTGF